MRCDRCGRPGIVLFTSVACDHCDPRPEVGAEAGTKHERDLLTIYAACGSDDCHRHGFPGRTLVSGFDTEEEMRAQCAPSLSFYRVRGKALSKADRGGYFCVEFAELPHVELLP